MVKGRLSTLLQYKGRCRIYKRKIMVIICCSIIRHEVEIADCHRSDIKIMAF